MKKSSILFILFITIILSSFEARALTFDKVLITDEVRQDLSVFETLNVTVSNNTKDSFVLLLPKESFGITLNGKEVKGTSLVNVSLDCIECSFFIAYNLVAGAKDEGEDFYTFIRTLNLPRSPRELIYRSYLPENYVVGAKGGEDETSIVPQPAAIETDGKRIILVWKEKNPDLPKIYSVKYHGHVEEKSPFNDIAYELSESSVWILILGSILIGAVIGAIIYKTYILKFKEKDLPYIPGSLLSPDEKKIVMILKKHKNKLIQKEIVKEIAWSKSKVSAVITNLLYKKIVEKEKLGRNYTVMLVKEVEV
jgi:uncharacterized membrane protein